MASASTGYLRTGNGIGLRDPYTGEAATSEADRAELWGRAVARVLQALDDAGVPTVLVHPVPQFTTPFDLPRCATARILLDACGVTMSRAQVADQQRPALLAEQAAVRSVPRARTVDFTDAVCAGDPCTARRGDRWLYRDSAHLSVDAAVSLTDRWRDLIATQVGPD